MSTQCWRSAWASVDVRLRSLLAAGLLIGTPCAVLAQNTIQGAQLVSESADELILEVRYRYTGDQGGTVYAGALALEAGGVSSRVGFGPAVVQRGEHMVRISLRRLPNEPASFVSDQVRVHLYAVGGEPFTMATFNFRKTWSQPMAALPRALPGVVLRGPAVRPERQPQQGTGASEVRERRFNSNGDVEIVYRDGSIKRLFPGGFTIISPNGQATDARFASAQPPTPPGMPPDMQHADWAQYESEHLLGVIRTLVGDNAATVDNYLAKEPVSMSAYARISARRAAVEMLVRP